MLGSQAVQLVQFVNSSLQLLHFHSFCALVLVVVTVSHIGIQPTAFIQTSLHLVGTGNFGLELKKHIRSHLDFLDMR
jgi:hypothetical protein